MIFVLGYMFVTTARIVLFYMA